MPEPTKEQLDSPHNISRTVGFRIEDDLLDELDHVVKMRPEYANRSHFFWFAIRFLLDFYRLKRGDPIETQYIDPEERLTYLKRRLEYFQDEIEKYEAYRDGQ